MLLCFPTKNLNWEILTKNLVTFKKYPNAHYELGNNFNCDFNLLMPMSLLLISNKKKVLSGNWLARTNNNFWCRQEIKIKFQVHYLDKIDFLSAIWHMLFFNKKWTGTREILIQLLIHDGTKNRLNIYSQWLLGGSLEVPRPPPPPPPPGLLPPWLRCLLSQR